MKLDINDWSRIHHAPKAPPLILAHDTSTALCRCCGKRKPRKGGKAVGGRFCCAECNKVLGG
jgi:hypothetical protein